MITKNVTGEVKELDGSGFGTVVFATLNQPDKDNDILLPGAIGEQIVPIMAAHDWSEVPIRKAWTYETNKLEFLR